MSTSTKELIAVYYDSLVFQHLSANTKRDYKYCIEAVWNTMLDNKMYIHVPIKHLDTPKAQGIYNSHAERGIPFANHCKAVMSKLFNFGIQNGYVNTNPFSKVVQLNHRPRKEVQSKEDIYKFIHTAYSEFKWRNIGVIVHMAYTWGQRLGDMRALRFKDYDFNNKVLTLEQSKRRAKVYLPTTEELHKVLLQQERDFGWPTSTNNQIIAPKISYGKVTGDFYDKATLTKVGSDIRKAAGLSSTFKMMDMRRTATTEMVDAGVPLPQIMSVTGHANAQSLTPYLKNTLTSATEALSKRNKDNTTAWDVYHTWGG